MSMEQIGSLENQTLSENEFSFQWNFRRVVFNKSYCSSFRTLPSRVIFGCHLAIVPDEMQHVVQFFLFLVGYEKQRSVRKMTFSACFQDRDWPEYGISCSDASLDLGPSVKLFEIHSSHPIFCNSHKYIFELKVKLHGDLTFTSPSVKANAQHTKEIDIASSNSLIEKMEKDEYPEELIQDLRSFPANTHSAATLRPLHGISGQYLAARILQDVNFELIFIWNRTISNLRGKIDESLILDNLDDFEQKNADIIVEVAHPSVTRSYGKAILKHCNYMIGSPTALCDEELLQELKSAATINGLYIPSGAFWGGEDLRKLSDSGLIRSLFVTMKKHPKSLKLEGYLKERNSKVTSEPTLLYEGGVRDVCALAPNNTNTMAAAALAVPSLGFDKVIGRLISDPSLLNYHIVEVEAFGYPKEDGSCFHVHTIRRNPAVIGEVTGEATYAAYFGSLKRAVGKGPGLHLC